MLFPERGFVDSIPNDSFNEELDKYQLDSHLFARRAHLWVLAMDCLGTRNCGIGHDEGEGSRGFEARCLLVLCDFPPPVAGDRGTPPPYPLEQSIVMHYALSTMLDRTKRRESWLQ